MSERKERWSSKRLAASLAAMGAMLAGSGSARADVMVIGSVKDNTLYQTASGEISNGSGIHFFVGRSGIRGGASTTRRGVLEFDIAGAIPSGSTITSATLRLNMSKSIAFAQTCTLWRVLQEWGEGASDAPLEEGQGAPSVAPDATWLHAMYPGTMWTNAGGDLSTTSHASVPVNGIAQYLFGSTAEMVADVQEWLDDPSTNHGWAVRGSEMGFSTATRWDTRENPVVENRPRLTIEFTPPSGCPIDYVPDGTIDFLDYLEFLNLYDAQDPLADLTHDGTVDFGDYLEFLNYFDGGC